MPKKKLFNGSNYVGFPVSDATYRALWMNSIYRNVSIAEIVRSIVDKWAISTFSAIPEDNLSIVESKVNKIMAQRKGGKHG